MFARNIASILGRGVDEDAKMGRKEMNTVGEFGNNDDAPEGKYEQKGKEIGS